MTQQDPVVDPEGNTFERSAIEGWLQRSQTSPITRAFLQPSMLNPNRALRDAIASFLQMRGEVPPGNSSLPSMLQPEVQPQQDVPEEAIALSSKAFLMPEAGRVGVEICIRPPEGSTPMPMDIVAVVDVSGSMLTPALVDQGGQQVDVGFSVLDVTKHALKTLIHSLRPEDRLCIVAFSTSASVVLPMTPMGAANQARAKDLVGAIEAGGTTNLWDGIRVALNELNSTKRSSTHMTSIFILTDGVPTEHLLPPRGIVATLQAQLKKLMPPARSAGPEGAPPSVLSIPPTIYTFGFGFNLDTQLLVDIARAGKGCFSFIPDSGFVGTVLVHTLANVSTTAGKYGRLTFSHPESAVLSMAGEQLDRVSPTKSAVSLDSIAFGQTRDVVLTVAPAEGEPLSAAPWADMAIELRYCNAKCEMVGPPPVTVEGIGEMSAKTLSTLLRQEFVGVLGQIASNGHNVEASQALIRDFIERNQVHKTSTLSGGLLADAQGQVSLAVSRADWFQRWGFNYVCSLASAHRQQRCNNFKDQGVANYGGRLFQVCATLGPCGRVVRK